jgi:hypothetical protein
VSTGFPDDKQASRRKLGTMKMKNLSDVANDLRLSAPSQDWGLRVADGARVVEFARYYIENLHNLDIESTVELIDLILASADRAAADGLAGSDVVAPIKEVARSRLFHSVKTIWCDKQ